MSNSMENLLRSLPSLKNATPPVTGGNRGVIFGQLNQQTGPMDNRIEYITLTSASNANDFGDLIAALAAWAEATSNGSGGRGVCNIGMDGVALSNSLEYVTISTLGNTQDFGDLITPGPQAMMACSNASNNRGVWAAGFDGTTFHNNMDYINISSISNATDFGDVEVPRAFGGGCSNGTNNRGMYTGGSMLMSYNVIDYLTITSLSNTYSFGDLSIGSYSGGSCSNSVNNRCVMEVTAYSAHTNILEYVTITSTGNSSDFGDLSYTALTRATCSNGTGNIGIWAGGLISNATSAATNLIEQITISTLSNSSDFGDLTDENQCPAATTNA